jgi:hypothetical protein
VTVNEQYAPVVNGSHDGGMKKAERTTCINNIEISRERNVSMQFTAIENNKGNTTPAACFPVMVHFPYTLQVLFPVRNRAEMFVDKRMSLFDTRQHIKAEKR